MKIIDESYFLMILTKIQHTHKKQNWPQITNVNTSPLNVTIIPVIKICNY